LSARFLENCLRGFWKIVCEVSGFLFLENCQRGFWIFENQERGKERKRWAKKWETKMKLKSFQNQTDMPYNKVEGMMYEINQRGGPSDSKRSN
jgi:hypothetical protein